MRKTSRVLLELTTLLFIAGPSTSSAVPTLDEMAGDWIAAVNVANRPAVHNFHDMLIVDRDLTSVFCCPGAQLWTSGPEPFMRGFPPVRLTLEGHEFSAKEHRAYAYRALRRNLNCDGLVVESDTRMVNERRAVLVRLRIINPGEAAREVALTLSSPGELDRDGVSVSNSTQREGVTTRTSPVQKPDQVVADAGNVRWEWRIKLAPGGEQVLEFQASDDGWRGEFASAFEECKRAWEQRWSDAFTPGNQHFSGNLPVLATDNQELARNYYMGAVTLLILERTQFPVSPRSFITSGEREPGLQFYWDAAMQATVWALLEPDGMKATLRRWLVQNVRSGLAIDIRETQGFDAQDHDRITGYGFNACTIFQTAYDYLRVTGDLAFLDEELETGQTVLQHLDAMATDWKTLALTDSPLADYGGNDNLLECAPAYIGRVPSVNAQNVLMMRQAAGLYAWKGNDARAKELREEASAFAPAVLALYKEGDGVWYGLHRDGGRAEFRHCVDYIYVGNALAGELTPKMRDEMTAFVKRELLMRDWMRAMSLKDDAAKLSDRPDHGPMGAFDGWVPLTVSTMWRLGSPNEAFDFYCRTAVVTAEGPFAQAREFYGPNREAYDAPVRVAERQVCLKECIAGVAFTDVVINTFFGFLPAIGGEPALVDPGTPRPFTGKLLHVRNQGTLTTITADADGLRLDAERSLQTVEKN